MLLFAEEWEIVARLMGLGEMIVVVYLFGAGTVLLVGLIFLIIMATGFWQINVPLWKLLPLVGRVLLITLLWPVAVPAMLLAWWFGTN